MDPFAAAQQNRAIDQSIASQRRVSAITSQQLRDQATVEREENRRAAARVAGRIRVEGAARGVGDPGRLLFVNAFESAFNEGVIDRNLANQEASVGATLNNNVASLENQRQSVFLATLNAGMNVASLALNLGGAISDLQAQRRRTQQAQEEIV